MENSNVRVGRVRTAMMSKSRINVESVYYSDSGTVPFASRLSFHVRQKMFRLFMELMRPGPKPRCSTWA